MKGGEANGTQRKLDPNCGDFDKSYFRIFLREKAKSPRQRRLWLKPKSYIGTPQELLLEGFFLS